MVAIRDAPLLNLYGENLIFKNNTISNSKMVTGLFTKVLGGEVSDITLVNISDSSKLFI